MLNGVVWRETSVGLHCCSKLVPPQPQPQHMFINLTVFKGMVWCASSVGLHYFMELISPQPQSQHKFIHLTVFKEVVGVCNFRWNVLL